MAQFQHKAARSLRTALISSMLLISQVYAQSPEATQQSAASNDTAPVQIITTAQNNAVMQQKQMEALAQIDKIKFIFNTIGQTLASGASNISKKHKEVTRKKLNLLQTEEIDKIERFASVHVTPEQLYQLVLFNSEVINVLEKAIETNLQTIPSFDFAAIQKKYFATEKNITAEKIAAVLQNNAVRLIKLDSASQKIGLSGLNSVYRGIRKFNKDWSVGFWAEHFAVYWSFCLWYIYVTSENSIAEFPLFAPIAKPLLAFKAKWVGSLPKDQTYKASGNVNIGKPTYTADEKYITGFVAEGSVVDLNAPFREIGFDKENNKATSSYKEITDKIQKSREAGFLQDKDICAGGKVTSGRLEADVVGKTPDHSLATRTQNGLGAIIQFDHKTPLVSASIASLFLPYFKEDGKLIAKKLEVWKNRLDDYLFGTAKKHTHEEVGIRTERFKDIVGREEVKAELSRVIDYICNPDRFDRAGIKVERGYLLAGEPQTGKTLMAKAFAGEISAALEKQGSSQKMRLFEISTENLAKKGIGYYMDLAKTFSPCILFLDELDLMRLQRDGDNKTLSEFLTTMSGSMSNNEKDQVIILAATNKPENLDFALRQHGRFGKMFWFGKPTFKHRVEFFIKECEKRCMNPSNFNFIALAQQTEGCSFGSLDIVFKKSLMHAKIENSPVTQVHFERAIDFEVRKLVPTGYSIPTEKEEVIAARQGGKALVSILLAPAKTLCSVTILPITQDLEEEHVTQQYNFGEMKRKDQHAVRYGNIFAYHLYDALDIQTQEELVKQCKILLASHAAQRVHGLSSCAFDKFDKQEAFNLAKTIVLEGLDAKEMAKDIRNQKLTQAYRLLEQYEAEVEALLTAHKKELTTIVKALQQHKTLSVAHINELLAGKSQSKTPAVTKA